MQGKSSQLHAPHFLLHKCLAGLNLHNHECTVKGIDEAQLRLQAKENGGPGQPTANGHATPAVKPTGPDAALVRSVSADVCAALGSMLGRQ